jgi:hypothetical protein
MATTIPIPGSIRDRLRTYGTAGMTYADILTRLMDEIDRREFLAEMRRRFETMTDADLVDLEDVE